MSHKKQANCTRCEKAIAGGKTGLCCHCRPKVGRASRTKFPWTPALDAELRAAYARCVIGKPSAAIDTLQRITGYPRYIVTVRAQKLGIARDTRRPWMHAELRLLAQYAGQISVKQIAALLGRTHASVSSRMEVENLRASVRSGYSIQQLAGVLGVDTHSIRKWINAGWLTLNAGRRISEMAVSHLLWVHLESLDLRLCNQAWLKDQIRRLTTVASGAPMPHLARRVA